MTLKQNYFVYQMFSNSLCLLLVSIIEEMFNPFLCFLTLLYKTNKVW